MKGKLNTILFSDIDVNWLNRYEKELRAKKCEETSMSVLFRTLRSAYNTAVKAHIVAKKYYPFNEYKVSKFNVKTKQRALTKEDVMKVVTTETIKPTQRRLFLQDKSVIQQILQEMIRGIKADVPAFLNLKLVGKIFHVLSIGTIAVKATRLTYVCYGFYWVGGADQASIFEFIFHRLSDLGSLSL